MREMKKEDYGVWLEEGLLVEMCVACRQLKVEIPIKELAKVFEEAICKAGRNTCARCAVRTISCPVSDWKLEKSLAFLKLANLGVELKDGDLINRIVGKPLNSSD